MQRRRRRDAEAGVTQERVRYGPCVATRQEVIEHLVELGCSHLFAEQMAFGLTPAGADDDGRLVPFAQRTF